MATPEPAKRKQRLRDLPPEERRAHREKQIQERRALERDVLALRLAGRSFEQISDDLGFKSRASAWKVYEAVVKRTVQAPADELRALSEARLETLRFTHWQRALGGDVPASVMVLRIERQLADLRGLNAPKEIDLRLEAREIAERYGLDPDEVLAEAQAWIKAHA